MILFDSEIFANVFGLGMIFIMFLLMLAVNGGSDD